MIRFIIFLLLLVEAWSSLNDEDWEEEGFLAA